MDIHKVQYDCHLTQYDNKNSLDKIRFRMLTMDINVIVPTKGPHCTQYEIMFQPCLNCLTRSISIKLGTNIRQIKYQYQYMYVSY